MKALVIVAIAITVSVAGLTGGPLPAVGAVSDATTELRPAAAQDPTTGNVLVVAESDDGRIYAARVNALGAVLDAPLAVSPTTTTAATAAAVTWDGTQFLVVWEGAAPGCGQDIRGARVSSSGVLLQTDIAFSACPGDQRTPSVAHGDSGTLVVWDDVSAGVRGVVIDAAGSAGSVIDVSPVGDQPVTAWNGTSYLVAWTASSDIQARRVASTGDIDDDIFDVVTDASLQGEPAIASDDNGWFVTWTQLDDTYDIYGEIIDADTAALGSFPISTAIRDQGTPSMSFDGTNYLVAWNDSRLDPGGGYYDIFGARVDPITETVIDSSAFSISTATGQQGSSALAWNGTQYLAVWQGDERDDHYKISGARVESDASILAPGDFPVFPTTMGPALEIGDVRIVEGNAGTSQIAQIPLTLSEPATSAVTAMYTLTGDTAQFASDWRPTTRLPQGTVTFPIGAVVKYVQVKIIGDSDTDGERTLHATVSNVSGAHLAGDDTGAVTILDDDATPANGISIGDVVIAEGDALTRPAKLPITLSAPAATDMTITLTRSGTAVRLTDDKMPAVKRVLVRAGHSSALVAVPILGDRLREQDETLYFEASATGMPFAARIGSVLIRDEASDAGPVVASAPAGDAFYTPPTVPKGPPGELVWSRVTATTGLATQHLVMYRSTSQRRMPTFVTARVWVPNGLVPGTGRDVVAWADGATGLGDECAPSRIPNGVAALTELLTAGNVVVATDYEGSGTPGAHAFLMARSEAQTIFDSIRTVAELGVPTSGRAVLLGASRGGHAVIAAAERRGYAPETDVLGAITLGPGVITPDDDGLINGSLTSDGKGYTMMSMRAMQQIYGPKASAVQSYLSYYLTSAGIADLPAADSCATAISHFAPVAGASIFNLTRGPIPAAADTLRQELTIGALGTSVPIMVMYGGADNLVPKAAIEDWLAFACGQSGPIDTHYYQFDGHVPVHPSDIAAWIAARFAGSPPGDACP